jgi:hypothetical protein
VITADKVGATGKAILLRLAGFAYVGTNQAFTAQLNVTRVRNGVEELVAQFPLLTRASSTPYAYPDDLPDLNIEFVVGDIFRLRAVEAISSGAQASVYTDMAVWGYFVRQ